MGVRAGLPAAVALVLLCGCTDDGAAVRVPGGGSGSGSASRPAIGKPALGGYVPASDLGTVANISRDACDIAAALPPGSPDFAAAAAVYAGGRHAFEPGGGRLSLRQFAAAAPRGPLLQQYARHFGDPTWLDTDVGGALAGTGPFAGQPDAVRRQAVLSGVQVAIPIAWALDELDAAQVQVDEPGGTDPRSGAAHRVDRAWAFYRGDTLTCAPFLVASEAGRDAGTGAALPDAIRDQMRRALAAATSGDAGRLRVAAAELRRLVVAVHVQAVLAATHRMDGAAASGDRSGARVRQVEARALFRIVEPLVAAADPAAAASVARLLGAGASPAGPQPGTAQQIGTALGPALRRLGITTTDIGTPLGERSTP